MGWRVGSSSGGGIQVASLLAITSVRHAGRLQR